MGESVEVIILGAVLALISTLFMYKFMRKKTSGNRYYFRIGKERKLSDRQIVHG